ncbi:MAG: hypothetical protein ACRC30_17025 [Clostridium sp.]
MGVWIEEFKRLIRVFLKNYVVAWGIIGIGLGCMFNNLAVFIPVCLCLGYYYEALYQERMKKN